MSRQPWRRFAIRAAGLTLVLAIAFGYVAIRYRLGIDWQVSRCLPDTRVVLIDLWSAPPARGGLIAFRGQGLAPLFPDGTTMVKILAGVPGDQVTIEATRTTVNGQEVARGLALAERLGRPAAAFRRSLTVPDGHYFVIGQSPDSFDSRYLGLIQREQVRGTAWRLG